MIVQGIECPVCREQIWSRHRHDFRYCGCGYCFVDGGRDYLRYGHGVTPDKQNHEITPEEWSDIAEANHRLGKPERVELEVPDPKARDPQEETHWLLQLMLLSEKSQKERNGKK